MANPILKVGYTLGILFFILSLLPVILLPTGSEGFIMGTVALFVSGFMILVFVILIRFQINPLERFARKDR